MIFACGLKSGGGCVVSSSDGVTWSDETLPGSPFGLYAIHGSADNNIYVAGRGGTHHFDGATWSFEELFGTFDTAYGLWVSPDGTKVYLVTVNRSTHKISGVWTEGSTGFFNRNCLWGFNPAANEIFAGVRTISATTGAGIQQYDGVGDYFDSFVVYQAGSYIGFNGIWGTGPNALWVATGYDFNNPHPSRVGNIYKWNGSVLALEHTTGPGEGLFAAHGVDANNIWAVGANGTILYYNGSTWTPQVSGSSSHLWTVWAVSATEVWVGGGFGGVPELLRYDGVSWSAVDVSSTSILGLYGLYGSGAAPPPTPVSDAPTAPFNKPYQPVLDLGLVKASLTSVGRYYVARAHTDGTAVQPYRAVLGSGWNNPRWGEVLAPSQEATEVVNAVWEGDVFLERANPTTLSIRVAGPVGPTYRITEAMIYARIVHSPFPSEIGSEIPWASVAFPEWFHATDQQFVLRVVLPV